MVPFLDHPVFECSLAIS